MNYLWLFALFLFYWYLEDKSKVYLLMMIPLFFFKKWWFQIGGMILVYTIYRYNLLKKEQSFKRKLELQFSIWLRQLEVLLAYNNVGNAISLSIENAPDLLVPYLNELSQKIKDNPQDESVYLSFLKEFNILSVERTMHHLYRYSVLGTRDVEDQLQRIIVENTNQLKAHRNYLFESRLSFYSFYGLLPMVLMSITILGILFLVLIYLMKGGWNI